MSNTVEKKTPTLEELQNKRDKLAKEKKQHETGMIRGRQERHKQCLAELAEVQSQISAFTNPEKKK